MLETNSSKEIRICMQNGNTMLEHSAPAPITIMILQGDITIGSNGDNIVLTDGEMICFDAKIPHSLYANQDSIVRLVLSKNDTFARVKNVLNPAR